MAESLPLSHPLCRMFAGLTEQTFMSELGFADTRLVDYLSGLLARFVHRDALFENAATCRQPLETLVTMTAEAEKPENRGSLRRELFRQVGDIALFWTGVYPEAIRPRSSRAPVAHVMREQGRRSYYLASTYTDTPTQADEAPVLRRLSEEFELCMQGLRKVRDHWEHPGMIN